MKMWRIERTFHVVVLAAVGLMQHWQKLGPALAGPGPERETVVLTAIFITALSFFFGVASVSDRLQEQLDLSLAMGGIKKPTVECAGKLKSYLLWGRLFMAIFAIGVSGWVSLVSIVLDSLYPAYRESYRMWRAERALRRS